MILIEAEGQQPTKARGHKNATHNHLWLYVKHYIKNI